MMIIDACMFFNETELFELRFNELDSVVDKFIVVEAAETFTGKKRETVFEHASHKVSYVRLNELQPPYTDPASGWQREKFQREQLLTAALTVSTSPDDILIAADCDEIPRAEAISAATPLLVRGIHRFNLDFFYYNVNNYLGEWPWGATIGTITQYQEVGGTHQARSNGYHESGRLIPNAGWHFSYFGGVNRIRTKVESFSHASDDFCQAFLARPDEEAKKDIAAGQDIFRTRGLNKFEQRASDDSRLPAWWRNRERLSGLPRTS